MAVRVLEQRRASDARDRCLADDRHRAPPDDPTTHHPHYVRDRSVALLRAAPIRGRVLVSARRVELLRRRPLRLVLPEAAQGATVVHRQHRPPPRAPPERRHSQLPTAALPRREP